MEVIVITSAGEIENEVVQINSLFDSGLTTLHLRKPKWSDRQIEDLLLDIPNHYHSRIVIHGHYRLAIKYKLKGVHLHRRHRSNSRKNRWKRFLLKLRHPSMVITTTFNSLESLRENKQRFTYAFLNSVFNSHSYYSQSEEAGVNMLRTIVGKSVCPVYALGGITAPKMPIVERTGFEGVGISSAVWKHLDKDPKELLSLFHAA